jgi:hypothetical protein
MDLSAIINSIREAIEASPVAVSPTADVKNRFQKTLQEKFNRNIRHVETCEAEYCLANVLDGSYDGYNDKCDVFVETTHYIVIVELDATRADQVAKKMLSRYFYAEKSNKPTVYICLLYPGTEHMKPSECVKYMNMGKDVLLRMNSSNRFIGGFVDGTNVDWKLIG